MASQREVKEGGWISKTLTVYRPQRSAIAGAEPGDWIDMGHLHWGIPLTANNQEVACAGYYSNLSPTLMPVSGSDFAFQLFVPR